MKNTLLYLAVSSALALAAGCAADSGVDKDKQDDRDAMRCATASVDAGGFCRASDGTFASASCCIANERCESASFDGTACRAADGTFAPAECCADLCDGAQLDAAGVCRQANGQFAFQACCADQCLQNVIADPTDFVGVEGSCGSVSANSCGGESPDGCFCDDICIEEGDCCADKADVCGGLDGEAAFSCEGFCGESAPGGGCFCDDACVGFKDCCPDKVDVCGGTGSALPDCDELACEGAAVDAAGVCRKPDGQFAKSSCCAAPPVCATAKIDAQGKCRRADNGQFAPALCCEGICDNAKLSRAGTCHNANGQFTSPGCCADQCVDLQGQSDRTDRSGSAAACN